MSIQAIFNQHAIDMLPKIKEILKISKKEKYNQILHITLQDVMNSSMTIENMNIEQLNNFEETLIQKLIEIGHI